MPTPRRHFPVLLTQAQRKAVALLLPDLTGRLKLDERNQRAIPFSVAELKEIATKSRAAVRHSESGMVRNSLRCLTDIAVLALEESQGIGAIPAADRLFQFKITLREIQPPIWRRIQIKDGPLDKLHEHIQTAMGWTNSHLHRFKIEGKEYGDPDLLFEIPADSCIYNNRDGQGVARSWTNRRKSTSIPSPEPASPCACAC